jgi:hypothetical protein
MKPPSRASLVSLVPLALVLVAAGRGAAGIRDGSFELGPPPSSAWTEYCSLPCERIGQFSSEWSVSAFDGTFDYWAGGYCRAEGSSNDVPVISSITQSVTVPTDSTLLTFHYISFRQSPDDSPIDGDHAYVTVNGHEVWIRRMTQANDTYPSWSGPVEIDLSGYEGQTVTLSFGAVASGHATGSIRFDLISLVPASTPVQSTSWGALKARFRGSRRGE